jgi:hypothetical protein
VRTRVVGDRSWSGFALVLVVALVALRVLAVGIALDNASTHGRAASLPGDVRRYHRIATHPGTPYRDFAVEYPPLSLALVEIVNGPTVRDTTVTLMWTQLLIDVGIAAILAWGWGRRAAIFYLFLGLAFVWYPFLYLRLDLLSVALAVGAMALARRRRFVLAGTVLGFACFAKLWPVVLTPLLALRRSTRGLVAFATVGVAGLAAWVAWGGPDGPVQVLTFRGARGWQIESTVGAVVHFVNGGRARIEQGAARAGVVAGWAKIGLPVLGLVGAGVIWWLASRIRHADARTLDGLAPLGAIVVLLLSATVFSPQYVSWLLPFAAIAAAGGERAIGWLTAGAAALSTLGFYLIGPLNTGDQSAMAVVLVRNALLVVLLGVVVVRLLRLARGAPGGRPRVPAAEHAALVHAKPVSVREWEAPVPTLSAGHRGVYVRRIVSPSDTGEIVVTDAT